MHTYLTTHPLLCMICKYYITLIVLLFKLTYTSSHAHHDLANSRGIEPPARKPKDNTDVVLFYWLYSLFLSTVALIKIANENQMSPTTHFFIFGP